MQSNKGRLATGKLRWGKFYWSDWQGDTALALCSLAAQGLLIRLLCIAAQGDPYGSITVKGKAPTERELRELTRFDAQHEHPKNAARDFRRLLDELLRHGVLTEVEIQPVDIFPAPSQLLPRRFLASSRMLHDGCIAQKRTNASQKRWKSAENHQKQQTLDIQNSKPNKQNQVSSASALRDQIPEAEASFKRDASAVPDARSAPETHRSSSLARGLMAPLAPPRSNAEHFPEDRPREAREPDGRTWFEHHLEAIRRSAH